MNYLLSVARYICTTEYPHYPNSNIPRQKTERLRLTWNHTFHTNQRLDLIAKRPFIAVRLLNRLQRPILCNPPQHPQSPHVQLSLATGRLDFTWPKPQNTSTHPRPRALGFDFNQFVTGEWSQWAVSILLLSLSLSLSAILTGRHFSPLTSMYVCSVCVIELPWVKCL